METSSRFIQAHAGSFFLFGPRGTGKSTWLRSLRETAVKVKSEVLFEEVRAGGRIPLIIGRGLTAKAREALGLPVSTLFRLPQNPVDTGKGFTLAQKMVGRACGLPDLKVEQAFELSDASAERSAGGCTVHLNKEPIIEYITSNITMLKWMIASGYSGSTKCSSALA